MYKIVNRKKLIATMIADAIGSIIFLPKLFKNPEPIETNEIKNILVIRTAYVGDVVMTLPILKPLKDRFPGSKITFLTSSFAKPVLENNPYVDEVATYDPFWFYPAKNSGYFPFIKSMKERQFDLIIEARGDIRELLGLVAPLKAKYKISSDIGGGKYLLTHVVPYRGATHRVEYHLDMARFLGCEIDRVEWGFYLTDKEEAGLDMLLKKYGISTPFAAAHPGSRLPLKKWPVEKCAALYDRIIEEYNMPLVILGAPSEGALVRDISGRMKRKPLDLAGRVSLRELAGVISRAQFFICNDSAPMHIAASMNTPTIAIFGPSKSRETGPYGSDRHRVVEKEFPCRFTCDESACRYKIHNACMHAIMPDDVLKAIRSVMSKG